MDGGAERLGVRLMSEVEEMGLSDVLASLRTLVLPHELEKVFNVPEVDRLLSETGLQQQQEQRHRLDDNDTRDPRDEPPRPPSKSKKGTHAIELVSPPPQHHPSPAGKTSLLHLLITHAILPSFLSDTPLLGFNAAVVLIDPLHHFSVPFLATTMFAHISSCLASTGHRLANDNALAKEVRVCVKRSLAHVHIFQPASWDSLLATLKSLPDYLFDSKAHSSTHRRVHSIILEDIHTFVPAIRTSPSSAGANSLTTASTRLTLHLDKLAKLLSCAVILTSHSATPASFRPPLPLSWPPGMQVTRLAVRRVEVAPFAPAISVEEAESERAQRWEAVEKGRFEVWKVTPTVRDGNGFVFRVGRGVRVERE